LTLKGSDLFDIAAPDQGLHLVAYLRKHRSDLRLESALREQGIVVRAMSRLYLDAKPRQALILGFSGFTPEQIRPSAERLVEASGPCRDVTRDCKIYGNAL
jgi:GntR family transcriptional regulator/MocR family aminotransferase